MNLCITGTETEYTERVGPFYKDTHSDQLGKACKRYLLLACQHTPRV